MLLVVVFIFIDDMRRDGSRRVWSCLCLMSRLVAAVFLFFFFNDTATTEIYTLSLHDALPIYRRVLRRDGRRRAGQPDAVPRIVRSEEHTSELQSHSDLVCRLLLEKKKKL